MPLYEIEVRRAGVREVRLADPPLYVGATVDIAGRRWLVIARVEPAAGAVAARFVCREVDGAESSESG